MINSGLQTNVNESISIKPTKHSPIEAAGEHSYQTNMNERILIGWGKWGNIWKNPLLWWKLWKSTVKMADACGKMKLVYLGVLLAYGGVRQNLSLSLGGPSLVGSLWLTKIDEDCWNRNIKFNWWKCFETSIRNNSIVWIHVAPTEVSIYGYV